MEISGFGGLPSFAELKAMREQMFAKSDTDGDGALSLGEFDVMRQNMPAGAASASNATDSAELFGQIDANGDGKVTQAELQEHRKSHGPGPNMNAMLDSSLMASLLTGTQESGTTSLLDLLTSSEKTKQDEEPGDNSLLALFDNRIQGYLDSGKNQGTANNDGRLDLAV